MLLRRVCRSLLALLLAGLASLPAWGQADKVRKLGAGPQSEFKLAIRHINGVRVGIAQFTCLTIVCQEPEESNAVDTEIRTASDAPPGKMLVEINHGSFEELLFGQNSNATMVRSLFERRLQQQLDAVERSGTLSDPQKEKLRLAGRGDIQHFLERAARIEAKFGKFDDIHDFDEFEKWVAALSGEVQSLQLGFHDGPFDGNSLFTKTLATTLTPEHAAQYARAAHADTTKTGRPESLALADKCWDVLGLRLERADAAALAAFNNKYRGGMRVADVRTESDAEKHGIRKGDILVGLHHWEVIRNEDIRYILNQDFGGEPVKFYVMRGQEVLTGTLRFRQVQK